MLEVSSMVVVHRTKAMARIRRRAKVMRSWRLLGNGSHQRAVLTWRIVLDAVRSMARMTMTPRTFATNAGLLSPTRTWIHERKGPGSHRDRDGHDQRDVDHHGKRQVPCASALAARELVVYVECRPTSRGSFRQQGVQPRSHRQDRE